VVFRARERAYGRVVAVKVLGGAGVGEETGRRFSAELRAMGALAGHPNIVTVSTSGRSPSGFAFIVMASLPGASLAVRLEDGPLPEEEAASIGVKLAGALETAHSAGILHRDLKPEKVLISAYGEPALCDFWIARISGGPRPRPARSRRACCTPRRRSWRAPSRRPARTCTGWPRRCSRCCAGSVRVVVSLS